MHILLCAATKFEISPVMEWLGGENKDVEILITGVGVTATTYALTKSIHLRRPDFILQAGVAGCLDPNLPLTKIVLVENEIMGDLGVEENGTFKSLFDLGYLDKDQFPWVHGKLANHLGLLKQSGLTIVDSITVNEISTRKERINYYFNTLGAKIESMEGAALHFVALMENIPFLQIRSLSNFAGERDKKRWVLDIAINTLNLELQRILSKLFYP